MKDLMRKKTVISIETEELLNNQVALEAKASSKYLAMASWCDTHGYENAAEYFYAQSEEERMHMLKIFHYINDMGGTAISPAIEAIDANFISFRDVFEISLDSEIIVTKAINHIVDKAKSEKDYSTEQFLQWFVQEQREEEMKARRAVELFDLLGEEKLALFMIDERIGKMITPAGAADSEPAA